jgi:hypothetical protein
MKLRLLTLKHLVMLFTQVGHHFLDSAARLKGCTLTF